MMTPIERFKDYLHCYAAKDLTAISAMFSPNITLRDWTISVKGKDKALAETQKNFNAASSIQIDILALMENADSVAGELKITVDHTEVLFVVDVVQFDADGLISAIKAYIGRAD